MKKFLYIFILLLIFSSCKKELDFDYHEIEPILVIEGQLNQNGCKVKLTHTTPMNEYMDTTHIQGARVYLNDISGGERVELECDINGVFASDLAGIVNHQYELGVDYDNNLYISDCLMRPATEILGIEFSWLKMPYDYVAILEIKFKELDFEDSYYWIKIHRNGKAYRWLLCDNRSASDGEITRMTMTSRKNIENEDEKDILRDGDVIEVDICTISSEMYDYLSALQISSNGPQMFEGEFCLGYFLASGVATSTIVYHPDELKER